MKLILLLTLFITFSTNSFADKKTLETVVTCEQHADSDQWTQIGIVIDRLRGGRDCSFPSLTSLYVFLASIIAIGLPLSLYKT